MVSIPLHAAIALVAACLNDKPSVCVWRHELYDSDYHTSCAKEFYITNELEPYEYCPGVGVL